jgi:hypothetical protein
MCQPRGRTCSKNLSRRRGSSSSSSRHDAVSRWAGCQP